MLGDGNVLFQMDAGNPSNEESKASVPPAPEIASIPAPLWISWTGTPQ